MVLIGKASVQALLSKPLSGFAVDLADAVAGNGGDHHHMAELRKVREALGQLPGDCLGQGVAGRRGAEVGGAGPAGGAHLVETQATFKGYAKQTWEVCAHAQDARGPIVSEGTVICLLVP